MEAAATGTAVVTEEGRGGLRSKGAPRSRTLSTVALCTSVFSMFYLLMSAFPYSGFMAMQLVPGLTEQNVGRHAGILSGSMAMGRMLSAWPMGVACDRYGRKFVLLFSTATNAALMLLFGLSPTYSWAVAVRFLTGTCNGTMVAARVSVTELAGGDRELEARGMGMVMSMIGFGMLVGPALGGVLSEPVAQYPNVDFGAFESLLLKYPFLLPNVVGTAIASTSAILIALTVDETLPANKLRSPKHIPGDIAKSIAGMFGNRKDGGYEGIPTIAENEEEEEDAVDMRSDNSQASFSAALYRPSREDSIAEDMKIIGMNFGETANAVAMCSDNSQASFSAALYRPSREDSMAEDMKITGMHFGETADAVAMCSRNSQASFSAALHRPSQIRRLSISTESPRAVRRMSTNISQINHNITSLMQDRRVRECLNCYWVTSLASTMAGETFPLFAMATVGGLSIDEKTIGFIGTGSGLMFVLCQYFIFSASMKHLGLHRTMVSSCLFAVIPVVLVPVSLLFKERKSAMMPYLSFLNGAMSIAFANWNACITITQNRAVDPGSRAKLNALGALGVSLARGSGPILAGALVAYSYTGGLVPPALGSLIMYSVIAILGAVAYAICARLEDEDEDGAGEEAK